MTTPDPVAALREEVAGVLAEHQRLLNGWGSCTCGAWPTDGETPWPQHQADALLTHLAPLVEARERVEALADECLHAKRPTYEAERILGEVGQRIRAANALSPTEERP